MSALKINGKLYSEWFFTQDLEDILYDLKDATASPHEIKIAMYKLKEHGYTAFPYHNGHVVLLSTNDKALEEIYLTWVNDCMTVSWFASLFHISEKSATTFLDNMKEAA